MDKKEYKPGFYAFPEFNSFYLFDGINTIDIDAGFNETIVVENIGTNPDDEFLEFICDLEGNP